MKCLFIFGIIMLSATLGSAQLSDQNGEPLRCGYAMFESRKANKLKRITLKKDDLNAEPFMVFWQKFALFTKTYRIDLHKNYQILLKSDFPTGRFAEGDISFTMNSAQPEFLELLKDFTSAIDDSNLLKILALEQMGEKIVGADLQLVYGDSELELNLTLKTNSENSAERITTRLKTLFVVTSSFLKNNPAEEFYKNAEISAKKEQIFLKGKMSKSNLINYLQGVY